MGKAHAEGYCQEHRKALPSTLAVHMYYMQGQEDTVKSESMFEKIFLNVINGFTNNRYPILNYK